MIFLAIHKIITRLFLIPIIIIYTILFLLNRGNSLSEHGIYNTIVFIAVLIIFIGGAVYVNHEVKNLDPGLKHDLYTIYGDEKELDDVETHDEQKDVPCQPIGP